MSEQQAALCKGLFGPEAFLSFWKAFGSMAGMTEPLVRKATRINLEVTGFAGNRARAYAEIPATLARCRSPQDVFAAQMQFWQAASREYLETARRIGDVMQVGAGTGLKGAGGAEATKRDVMTLPEITFQEPRSDSAGPAPQSPASPRLPSDRRVAA